MISILIPVYNYNIISLVYDLHKQAVEASVPFEIIVLDDFSSALLLDQNRDIEKLPHVRFVALEKNIGRAAIRNKLASMAMYGSLLFMDCDSEVTGPDYIKNYLPYCGKEMVVCGGRSYRPVPPEEPELILRWLYGINREEVPATVRNRVSYHSFMTNNFLISKSVFEKIMFDETLVQYGHEDTLFGFELRKRHVPIEHIQNPLIHTGLEIAREFLRKTAEGIENLILLVEQGKIDRQEFRDIRLLKAYNLMRRSGLTDAFLVLYYQMERTIMNNLLGGYPSLRAFDTYKLAVLAKRIRKSPVITGLFKKS